MKVLTASQIRACDAFTVHSSGIQSVDLMERAASRCVEWISRHFLTDANFVILCGNGNNGGDGLALTRLLYNAGYGGRAFLLEISDELSPDALIQSKKLQHLDNSLLQLVPKNTFISGIGSQMILIDTLFGTGLNRPLEGWIGRFIEQINELPNRKISIDIPSGLPADTLPEQGAAIFRADDTLSFQFYKRSFLHPETEQFCGRIHLLDIGLDAAVIEAMGSPTFVLTAKDIRSLYRERKRFSHKGAYGTALLVGGSYGMMGAMSLCVRGALRAGAGKVKSVVPSCGYDIMQTTAPEAMCSTSGERSIEEIRGWEHVSAVGIGPGMEVTDQTTAALEVFLGLYKRPLVLDAGALSILAGKPVLLRSLPEGSILTPHPKEFERLFGSHANSMLAVESARRHAMEFKIIIVLKGHRTAVLTPSGKCYYNSTGNPGLATGGTGDVLTGMITAALAQGYQPEEATLLSVYLHGLSADISLQRQSMESMVAGDIIEFLGPAFKQLTSYPSSGQALQ